MAHDRYLEKIEKSPYFRNGLTDRYEIAVEYLERSDFRFQTGSRNKTVGWIKMPLDMEVGLGPGDIVIDGDPALPLKGAQPPPLFAHVYCGQTVAHLSYC